MSGVQLARNVSNLPLEASSLMIKNIVAAAVLTACLLLNSPTRAENAPKHSYQTVRVADGIVAFVASESNTDVVSGNCIAVIGDDGVLVVDTTAFPSHARQIIAEIRQMTSQPVRFVVHTHWHPDHLVGDGEFRAAYPGVAFVSTAFTQKAIAELAPKYIKGAAEAGPYAARIRKQIQDGKDDNGKTLTDADKKYLNDFANSLDFAGPEYQQYKTILPNVTFDDSLKITLGKREVQVMFLGRGNTHGDAIVYVPDAKVAMAGDLLVAPTPYSYGSFLTDWIQTLAKLKALGATTIVPGHGPVEHDYAYLDLVSSALQSVLTQVQDAVAKNLSLEDTRKKVDLSEFKKKFCGADHDREIAFRTGFVDQAIERAYQETKYQNED
jgi:cyclase